ncbi:AraC family transcriptional regulator [Bosea sp. TAF32]|uniref:AraC family transcriptional regulator n=1 Tax=Bosea sp. TAF32 TaxID=3237482 RepID=UPI003F931E7D
MAWKAALSRLVDCSIPADFDPASFNFYGCTWQLPEAFLQINGGSAMTMSRPQRAIDDRPNSQMSLYLVLSGEITTDYDGRKRSHSSGDIVAIDYSRPYECHTSGYEGITITFDRASAPSKLQGDVHGMVLTADSSAGVYLGGQIRSLVDHVDGLSVDQAQSAVDGILRFAETTLPAAAPRKKYDDFSVLDRARRLARGKLSDPDFGPDELANALSISRSKLFRSFEDHGGVQRWLLGERLKASLRTIVLSEGKLKISAVAHQHGFRSEAHFSRAFKKRYETSPSFVLDLAMHSKGSSMYLSWVKNDAKEERATIEAWLASALGKENSP